MAKIVHKNAKADLQVVVTCSVCKEACSVEMTHDQHNRFCQFQSGNGHIQTLLSDVPQEIREMFLSGICPDCWKKMFG